MLLGAIHPNVLSTRENRYRSGGADGPGYTRLIFPRAGISIAESGGSSKRSRSVADWIDSRRDRARACLADACPVRRQPHTRGACSRRFGANAAQQDQAIFGRRDRSAGPGLNGKRRAIHSRSSQHWIIGFAPVIRLASRLHAFFFAIFAAFGAFFFLS